MKISVFKIGKYGVPKSSQCANRVWRKLNISVSLWKKEHSHLNLVLDHALRKKKKELTHRTVVNICLLKYISPDNWSGMLVHLRKLFSGLILFFFLSLCWTIACLIANKHENPTQKEEVKKSRFWPFTNKKKKPTHNLFKEDRSIFPKPLIQM